jgi:hypothetical protein
MNSVHLLVTPRKPLAIAKLMQSVGRHYVWYVNDRYHRGGTLREGHYKASLVDCERYVLTWYRYIELNPVRIGMVSDPADYRWPSYRRNAGEASKRYIVVEVRWRRCINRRGRLGPGRRSGSGRLLGRLLVETSGTTASAAHHLHVKRHDLGSIAFLSLLILPLAGLDPPFDIHLRSLMQIFLGDLGGTAKQYHPVPFRAFLAFPGFLISPGFTRGQAQVGYGLPARHVANLRLGTEMTD